MDVVTGSSTVFDDGVSMPSRVVWIISLILVVAWQEKPSPWTRSTRRLTGAVRAWSSQLRAAAAAIFGGRRMNDRDPGSCGHHPVFRPLQLKFPMPSNSATTRSPFSASRMPTQVPVVTAVPAGTVAPSLVTCLSQVPKPHVGVPSACVPRRSTGSWLPIATLQTWRDQSRGFQVCHSPTTRAPWHCRSARRQLLEQHLRRKRDAVLKLYLSETTGDMQLFVPRGEITAPKCSA